MMNSTAKLAYYTARIRKGDNNTLSRKTGYSTSHISNVRNGRRNTNNAISNAMYTLSANRIKNSLY